MTQRKPLAGEGKALALPLAEAAEAVNAAARRPLYAVRQRVYPKRVAGVFRRLKWAFLSLALAIYYVTPWLRWDRGPMAPDQAVLLDFPNRKFYFFWIELWPHEVYFLTGLLILAALILFLVTALAGRVWCGYACPQTVWTDLFVHVERWIEGDRTARMRLDKAPWTAGKVAKKLLKHGVWLMIAIATGGAWVFYFADAPTLARALLAFEGPLPAYVFIGLFTFCTYTLGGIAREQVCIYMCPWPRIQGALFDDEALLVTYRADRGEPRGPHKKGEAWAGRGDCIDCKQCIAVCPMGIDIRDGPQLECIQCALCIDACNAIMDRVGRPRGLIAYESFNNFERRGRGLAPRLRLLRPRTLLYAALILVIGTATLFAFAGRADLDLSVQKDRNPLFVTLSDGSVRNGYTLKILNKAHQARRFTVAVEGLDGARLILGLGETQGNIAAAHDSVRKLRLFIDVPQGEAPALRDGTADIALKLTDVETGVTIAAKSTFKGPRPR
ncbi:MAG: cytochrome c oxidase accessory protein CcoG [Pseudomonadota bacterium]